MKGKESPETRKDKNSCAEKKKGSSIEEGGPPGGGGQKKISKESGLLLSSKDRKPSTGHLRISRILVFRDLLGFGEIGN